jgi:hypothetical protein
MTFDQMVSRHQERQLNEYLDQRDAPCGICSGERYVQATRDEFKDYIRDKYTGLDIIKSEMLKMAMREYRYWKQTGLIPCECSDLIAGE